MQIPLVDLKAQYATIKSEVGEAIQRVLDNTSFMLGKEVADFEAAFAAFVQAEGAVGVASGTGALRLALQACDIGRGDEVVIPSHTFFATGEAVAAAGAKPVCVEVNPLTYNMDAEAAEAAITPRTKALMPVHLYGQPADMDPLLEMARKHSLRVIEDAAQAHGAEYRGRRCGGMGDLACFSFYPGKNLGAYGDGGAVTGNDEDLLAKVRLLRDHGRTTKYEHVEFGWGERLDGLQAAVLAVKLTHLENWTEARRAHAAAYNEQLAGLPVATPSEMENVRHVYHLYVIQTDRRDAVLKKLNEEGVGAGLHYPIPLHRQPAFVKHGYDTASLPVTEKLVDRIISLPIFPELTRDQLGRVVDVIKSALSA